MQFHFLARLEPIIFLGIYTFKTVRRFTDAFAHASRDSSELEANKPDASGSIVLLAEQGPSFTEPTATSPPPPPPTRTATRGPARPPYATPHSLCAQEVAREQPPDYSFVRSTGTI